MQLDAKPIVLNLLAQIEKQWQKLKKIKADLNELGEAMEREKNIDFLKYQIKEIEDAAVFKDEEEELVLNAPKSFKHAAFF